MFAGVVLGAGIAAVGAGTVIALAYRHDVAGSKEDNLIGLGMACGGVAVAMVGTMLWFNVPHASAQVSFGGSSITVAGRF